MVDIIIIKDADEKTIRDILGSKLPEAGRDDQSPETIKSVDIEQKVDKKPEQKTTRRVGNWTKREDRILKKHYAKKDNALDFELLTSILPNRTKGAIIHRAYELKLTNRYRKRAGYKHHNKPQKKSMPIIPIKQAKWSEWTKAEDDILRENYGQEGRVKISRIRKLMPHRTKGSIMVRACQLKITNRNRHRSKHYKKKVQTAKPKRIVPREQIEAGLNGIREYWKYIKARKQAYIEAGYKTKIATGMAKTDWAKKKNGQPQALPQKTNEQTPTSTKTSSIPEKFPSFENVDKQFEPLVESITKHIIANKGSKLTFLNTRDILDVTDGRQWYNFVVEFMLKSQLISEYFNVPNKFKHIKDGKYDLIIYDN
jgi:hypothetical protein